MKSNNKFIWAKNILQFVSQSILDEKKSCLEDEFFHIALNSELNEKNYNFKDYPLYDVSNPSRKVFYYVLRTQDFFLNS